MKTEYIYETKIFDKMISTLCFFAVIWKGIITETRYIHRILILAPLFLEIRAIKKMKNQ